MLLHRLLLQTCLNLVCPESLNLYRFAGIGKDDGISSNLLDLVECHHLILQLLLPLLWPLGSKKASEDPCLRLHWSQHVLYDSLSSYSFNWHTSNKDKTLLDLSYITYVTIFSDVVLKPSWTFLIKPSWTQLSFVYILKYFPTI